LDSDGPELDSSIPGKKQQRLALPGSVQRALDPLVAERCSTRNRAVAMIESVARLSEPMHPPVRSRGVIGIAPHRQASARYSECLCLSST